MRRPTPFLAGSPRAALFGSACGVPESVAEVVSFASLLAARADTAYPDGTLGIIPTGNVRMVGGVWVPEFVYRMGSPVTLGTLSGKVLPSAEGWTHLEDGPENITTDGTHVRLWTDNAVERAQVSMNHTETGYRFLWVDMMHRQDAQNGQQVPTAEVTFRDGPLSYPASTRGDDPYWGTYRARSNNSNSAAGTAIVDESAPPPNPSVERRLTLIADVTYRIHCLYLDGLLVAANSPSGAEASVKTIVIGDGSTNGTLDWYLRSLAWGVA